MQELVGSLRSEQWLFLNFLFMDKNIYARNRLRKPLSTTGGRMENTQDSSVNEKKSEGTNASSIEMKILCKVF